MRIEDYENEYSPTAAAASRARAADPAAAQRLVQARAESQRPRRRITQEERAQAAPLDTEEALAKALLALQAVTGIVVGVERKRSKQR
jgi:hypothetical protein